jgi:hypothetical protein
MEPEPAVDLAHGLAHHGGPGRSVLIIEDNADIASNIGDYCEARGWTSGARLPPSPLPRACLP